MKIKRFFSNVWELLQVICLLLLICLAWVGTMSLILGVIALPFYIVYATAKYFFF